MATTPAKRRAPDPAAKQAPRKRTPNLSKPRTSAAKSPRLSPVSVSLIATIGTLALGGGLAVIGYALMRHADEEGIRPGSGARRHDEGDIRHAGPDAMRTPHKGEWETTDQTSDESFPASDPPGTY
jgi:hypothetical protein